MPKRSQKVSTVVLQASFSVEKEILSTTTTTEEEQDIKLCHMFQVSGDFEFLTYRDAEYAYTMEP